MPPPSSTSLQGRHERRQGGWLASLPCAPAQLNAASAQQAQLSAAGAAAGLQEIYHDSSGASGGARGVVHVQSVVLVLGREDGGKEAAWVSQARAREAGMSASGGGLSEAMHQVHARQRPSHQLASPGA